MGWDQETLAQLREVLHMPDPTTAPAPVFMLAYHPDGKIEATIPPEMLKGAGALNWLAIIQVLLAAAPQVMALIAQILAAFNPTPTPTPSPLPPAK